MRRRLKGFEARVFQHKYDHLKGILCYDRFPPEDREAVQKSIEFFAQPKLTSYLLNMTTPNNDTMEFPDTESLLRLLLIEKNFSPELRGAINYKA